MKRGIPCAVESGTFRWQGPVQSPVGTSQEWFRPKREWFRTFWNDSGRNEIDSGMVPDEKAMIPVRTGLIPDEKALIPVRTGLIPDVLEWFRTFLDDSGSGGCGLASEPIMTSRVSRGINTGRQPKLAPHNRDVISYPFLTASFTSRRPSNNYPVHHSQSYTTGKFVATGGKSVSYS